MELINGYTSDSTDENNSTNKKNKELDTDLLVRLNLLYKLYLCNLNF
jgi:hypothetical protein